MRPPATTKYRFRIRTRAGAIIDNLTIPGRDPGEAERKLRQIYKGCEILDRDPPADMAARLQSRLQPRTFENVVRLKTASSSKKTAGR